MLSTIELRFAEVSSLITGWTWLIRINCGLMAIFRLMVPFGPLTPTTLSLPQEELVAWVQGRTLTATVRRICLSLAS